MFSVALDTPITWKIRFYYSLFIFFSIYFFLLIKKILQSVGKGVAMFHVKQCKILIEFRPSSYNVEKSILLQVT